MYNVYNIAMHLVHFIIILLSVCGFLFSDYLVYYLILQFLILCSWLAYGLYDNRWGHCVITEIQWSIKDSFGFRPQTESYIQYWVKYKWKLNTKESSVNNWTTAIFGTTSLIGILRYIELIP